MLPQARNHLLQIVDSLHPGGMENIMVRVCNRLQERAWKVTVVCITQGGPFSERLHSAVDLRILHKPPGFSWEAVRKLRQWMHHSSVDLVHTHHLGGLIYASLARNVMPKPRLVHSEHILWDAAELGWKRQWQRKLLYTACACVFTVSRQQLKQMQSQGYGHPRMTTIVNGVDTQQFRPSAVSKAALRHSLGMDPNGLWLIKVARFGESKRHTTLIQAFEKAHQAHPNLRLLLVGDGGPEKDKVLRRMQESPVKWAMLWAGFQQDPTPYYQAADVLTVSSSFEGLPNAVLEGMACGLPILANDACGIREVMTDKEHGWIADYASADQLATGMTRAASTPQMLLDAMGTAASKHVQQNFSLQGMLDQYEQLYTSTLSRSRKNTVLRSPVNAASLH